MRDYTHDQSLDKAKHSCDRLFEAQGLRQPVAAVDALPGHEAETGRPDLPFSAPTPIFMIRRVAVVERLPVMPRAGDKPVRTVTEAQARSLMALGLIEPVGRGRFIRALMIRRGVAISTINAALRAGAGNRLPRAEDNRTVRSKSYSGHGITFEQIHVDEWDDGRQLDNRCIEPAQAAKLGARVKSRIDRGGDE